MTARASFEQACHAALTRHRQQLREGVYPRTADNQFVDTLLKAADTYAHGASIHRQRRTITLKQIDAALETIRAGAQ